MFVIGEHYALRQDVGDHQQPFRRYLAQVNDAPRVDPFARCRIDHDVRLFTFRIGVGFADDALQADEKSRLLDHLQIEHDDGAIAEEHSHAALSRGDSERRDRQAITAIERAKVDTVADQQSMHADPLPTGKGTPEHRLFKHLPPASGDVRRFALPPPGVRKLDAACRCCEVWSWIHDGGVRSGDDQQRR